MDPRPFLLAMPLTLGVALVGFEDSRAQSATPPAYPATPKSAECMTAPLEVSTAMDLLATPLAVERASTPEMFEVPTGEPTDAETAADVVATLHQVFACANAGDPLRFSALFTDSFIRDFYAGAPRDDVLGFLSSAPQPLPTDQRRVIIDIGEVQLLDDGRAGVVIVLDEPADPRTDEPDYAILEEVDGRWLVDEIHEG